MMARIVAATMPMSRAPLDLPGDEHAREQQGDDEESGRPGGDGAQPVDAEPDRRRGVARRGDDAGVDEGR